MLIPQIRSRAAAALVLALACAAPAAGQDGDMAARVDSIFARWSTRESPGCAVSVVRGAQPVLTKAYGMASLELGVPNTVETVFESGSVAKQFTAAAVALLAQDGRLSLEDDVRKHVPELPDYGAPITIRQMLNHTSGLRDWGAVAAVAGAPRGSRVYTQEHVLDIARRQRALNHAPGAEFLYSNTNYNLMVDVVQRVSGMSFADFTRTRLFEPLGMTSTLWRDDYTRVVRGRATAYSRHADGAWHVDMPPEDAHGNGGLLTTVADMQRWNANLARPVVGGAAFPAELERRGRLSKGAEIRYALGLFVSTYRGVPEVAHDGATSGYRAFLARYPAQELSVALLCNGGDVDPGGVGRRVAALYLPEPPREAPQAAGERMSLTPAELERYAGTYRNLRDNTAVRITADSVGLRVQGGGPFVPLSRTAFRNANGVEFTVTMSPDGVPTGVTTPRVDADTGRFVRVEPWTPSPADLAALAGEYTSDDAQATQRVVVEEGKLVVHRGPGDRTELTPVYRDAFSFPGGFMWFRRDAAGRVTGLGVGLSRARDVPFRRVR